MQNVNFPKIVAVKFAFYIVIHGISKKYVYIAHKMQKTLYETF